MNGCFQNRFASHEPTQMTLVAAGMMFSRRVFWFVGLENCLVLIFFSFFLSLLSYIMPFCVCIFFLFFFVWLVTTICTFYVFIFFFHFVVFLSPRRRCQGLAGTGNAGVQSVKGTPFWMAPEVLQVIFCVVCAGSFGASIRRRVLVVATWYYLRSTFFHHFFPFCFLSTLPYLLLRVGRQVMAIYISIELYFC